MNCSMHGHMVHAELIVRQQLKTEMNCKYPFMVFIEVENEIAKHLCFSLD